MKVSHAVIGRIIPPKSVDSVTVNSIVNRYTAISLSELAQATNEFSFVSQISTALSAISQLGSQQQSLREVVGRLSTSELLKKKMLHFDRNYFFLNQTHTFAFPTNLIQSAFPFCVS